MNGEVNGTMEAATDTFEPSHQETTNKEPIGSVATDDDNPKRESNHTDSIPDHNPEQDPLNSEDKDPVGVVDDTESISKVLYTDTEPGNKDPIAVDDTEPISKVLDIDTEQKTNDSVSNHCGNSNESADSVVSSQAHSETAPQGFSKGSLHFQEIESCDDDSESDDDSVLSGTLKATDTVSIDSDSDEDDDNSSHGSRTKSKNSDIIILDAENRPRSLNGNSRDSGSPEIHEIISDTEDCVVTDSIPATEELPRRSSRASKRKVYDDMINGDDDDDDDIEEVQIDDPLAGKLKTPSAKIPKTLTKLEMAAKAKSIQDHKDSAVGKIPQNLYQSMVARGLVVTPTTSSGKTTSATQVSPSLPTPTPTLTPQVPQVDILPSLTDDMFVVEAPSFIVPYVYEKPSVKPFRNFVDQLGKELEEIKAKEENERLEKAKEEKEKREQDRKEKRERGEEVEDSPDEDLSLNKTNDSANDEKKKKKAEKRARRKARDDDDASWHGESSPDSEEDETLSDDDTVVLKDKLDSMEELKHVADLAPDKVIVSAKSDSYFDCSLGKFFVNIGLNLVQEYVQSDLLKQQNRKLYREKKGGHSTKATLTSIASLTKNLDFSKENNAPYTFAQKKCEFCSFKAESQLIMENHLETPHMKNNLYKCNFCEFEVKSPHDILCHMEAKHNVRGRLERAPAYHQCPNCPFEDNGKGKLGRHQIACAKRYKPEHNLAPPIDWEPPAKIPKVHSMGRARNTVVGPYQGLGRGGLGPAARGLLPGTFARVRGRSPAHGSPVRGAHLTPVPAPRGLLIRHNAALLPNNYPLANNGKSKAMHQPSLSITPLPQQPQPVQVPVPSQTTTKSTFVICEICDGYIKDLEQLRNHMQWIHKVKIHPKMIYNRPPLNCQKCQFRFFTDQGLERHLLGSHGLVTSSMQEAANKGKDAGRCPVCGRVYQWKLLNHVARDHNLTLKPAHLSYKCTVCTATFGMYKQFENHVYSAHSVVAKRVMDKSKSGAAAKPANESLLKPPKTRDEVTFTPQAATKSQTSAKK